MDYTGGKQWQDLSEEGGNASRLFLSQGENTPRSHQPQPSVRDTHRDPGGQEDKEMPLRPKELERMRKCVHESKMSPFLHSEVTFPLTRTKMPSWRGAPREQEGIGSYPS